MAKFRKGLSGNPNGRPRGSRNRATLLADELFNRALFGADQKAWVIIGKTVAMAEAGDTTCIRLCLERIAPPRKDRPIQFALPQMTQVKDAVMASAAIVKGVSTGDLTPSEAVELSKVVENFSRHLQAEDFDARLAKLEKALPR